MMKKGSGTRVLLPVPRESVAIGETLYVHPLLAGIRAGGATLATFPKTKASSVACAQEWKREREVLFVRRTVAGAAQIQDAWALPASRLTVPE